MQSWEEDILAAPAEDYASYMCGWAEYTDEPALLQNPATKYQQPAPFEVPNQGYWQETRPSAYQTTAPCPEFSLASARLPTRWPRTSVITLPLSSIRIDSSLGRTILQKVKQLHKAMVQLEDCVNGTATRGTYIKPNIKASDPVPYNRRASIEAFQKFVEQGVKYLIDGQFMPNRHLSKLGMLLTRIVKQYFNSVVKSPEQWTTEQVF
jgi:hypothetical protein